MKANEIFAIQINKLHSAMQKNDILESIIMGLCLFLVSSVICTLLAISIWIGIILAIILTTITLIRKFNSNFIQRIAKKHPELDEQLLTAYENQNVNNPIITALLVDTCKNLFFLDITDLVDKKRIALYIGVSIIASSFLLFMTFTGFQPDIRFPHLSESTEIIENNENKQNETDSFIHHTAPLLAGLGANEDIYGEEQYIKVKHKNLELEIYPSYEFTDEQTKSRSAKTSKSSVVRVGEPTSQKLYSQQIPLRLEAVVRTYFEKIADL
jgi:MFS superfamily sulfate permease-like transporter